MTEELSKEELLAWFDDLACGEESIDMWTLEESKQANQQIRELIEDYDVMEAYKKDWEHPKVSKEFVEKYKKELLNQTGHQGNWKLMEKAERWIEEIILEMLKEIPVEVIDCLHKKTVCINEEGNAGVFCADCGKQLEKEC